MTDEEFLAEFGHLAAAPRGVKRLRELILDLALAGRLTSPVAGSEPASNLRRLVDEDRARLVAQKAIRKTQQDGESDPRAWLERPHGRVLVRLQDICALQPKNTGTDGASEAAFLPMEKVPAGWSAPQPPIVRPWADIHRGYSHFATGDVLLAKITPCFQNGKSTVFEGDSPSFGAGTTELHVLRPLAGIDPRWLLIVVKAPAFLQSGRTQMTGTAGQQRVPRSFVERFQVEMPPLEEQRRIVARVDELQALCEEIEQSQEAAAKLRAETLRSALAAVVESDRGDADDAVRLVNEHVRKCLAPGQGALEVLGEVRKAILELAVRGRLVPQDSSDTTGAALLGDIQRRRIELVERGEMARAAPSSASSARREVDAPVPLGWCTAQVGDFLQLEYGKSLPKERRTPDGPFPVLGANGPLGWCESPLVTSPAVVVGRKGSAGAVNLVRTPSWPTDVTYFVRPVADECLEYVAILLRSMDLPALSNGIKPGLNRNTVHALPITIPPAREQERIVTRVGELMALCDEIEAAFTTERALVTELAESAIADLLVEHA